MPAVSAHQCHLPVPISATYQCLPSVPSISTSQFWLSVPVSAAYQCQSVQLISASQCRLSVII
ncbi:unnamed protein product [Staurois parvus]|uniref:Uncharacterized protein n=1 Tax=Staurois parvus TaxID=386267 RepID=A0ABN9FKM2_9NEOB|nr:unnamed protein product [Staurois parvus]